MSSGFTFHFSLSVLNHLGRNLYRSFITVLGEAISNSWDADANNVWIYIDRENNTLVVKDDGVGMTADDFQNKFLKIGYSKRKEGKTASSKKRPFIGRKGIGKLALLSCADTITVITKTANTNFVGGTIDNSGLDNAINEDLEVNQYGLGDVDHALFGTLTNGMTQGTVIHFQNIHEGIRNKIDYIRKLIALYFRFSLIDNSFCIHLDDRAITIDELSDLANDTQLLWLINEINDDYVTQKLLDNSALKQNKQLAEELPISGFIASVEKPSQLKIRDSEEKVSVDLYVNGRLREKDILKHIPTTSVVESYLYGQIHYNGLDDEDDRFTSSREGIVSDDPKFVEFLNELKKLLRLIIEQWDVWRIELRQEGDSENKRITRKERKSKELFNTIVDEFLPPQDSSERSKVEGWVNDLQSDAEFNFASYGECFVSENLLRNVIRHKNIPLTASPTAQNEVHNAQNGFRAREGRNKQAANITFDIRQNPDDFSYLEMKSLAFLSATIIADQQEKQRLEQDAVEYKPVRDAVAHTALLTNTAKGRLTATYENIKAKVKELLKTP